MTRLGVVVIGRNEGERLRKCLESVVADDHCVVYVDSGSTDGSIALARELGAKVVCLDTTIAFSAARARNAGYHELKQLCPEAEWVQFVDGDCQLDSNWLNIARQTLVEQPRVAVVAGRRRERFPNSTIYNRLCDLEWDTPVGDVSACGGDALMRTAAFDEVGGFNPTLIAGEEPELCVRLRSGGWKIWRLPAEMTRHDAAMTRFRQWYRRTRRAGHAYAEGAAMHGRPPICHWRHESRSIWFWGIAVPLIAVGFAVPTFGISLGLLAGYAYLGTRIYYYCRRCGRSSADSRLVAFFTVLGKFPEALGQCDYWIHRIAGQRTPLIEYKECAT